METRDFFTFLRVCGNRISGAFALVGWARPIGCYACESLQHLLEFFSEQGQGKKEGVEKSSSIKSSFLSPGPSLPTLHFFFIPSLYTPRCILFRLTSLSRISPPSLSVLPRVVSVVSKLFFYSSHIRHHVGRTFLQSRKYHVPKPMLMCVCHCPRARNAY